jgi:hypothetical protein
MAAGLPAGGIVEVEFTHAVWTDVTPDLDNTAITIHIGRTTVFSQPGAGTMSGIQLRNQDGRYTPQSQVLADGVTPHPYYPNVLPHLRIRYSNSPAGTRFTGYIQGWAPGYDANGIASVALTATDSLDRLSKGKMTTALQYGVQAPFRLTPNPLVAVWPMNEPAGVIQSPSADGAYMLTVGQIGSGGAVNFGGSGVYNGNGSAVTFAPADQTNGKFLHTPATWGTQSDIAIEMWVQTTYVPVGTLATGVFFSLSGGSTTSPLTDHAFLVGYDADGHMVYQDRLARYVAFTTDFLDGGWHQIGIIRSQDAAAGGHFTVHLYCDGVDVYQVQTTDTFAGSAYSTLTLGSGGGVAATYSGHSLYTGHLGYVAAWSSAPDSMAGTHLPKPKIDFPGHYFAGKGFPGDKTGQRIGRYMDQAGVPSADVVADAGIETVSPYGWAGADPVSASQDMATTEGGGSVFYVYTDGKIRFRDRTFRSGTVVMTIDAESDLDGDGYQPSFDELTLTNSVTVTRATASDTGGALTTQTVKDQASIAAYDLTPRDITTYAQTDAAALRRGQSELSGNSQPGFRLVQVTVDMMTAQTAGLYAQLATIEIGSRIRVVGLPAGQSPASQIDLFVEGWTETIGSDQYTVAFDTSPAGGATGSRWSAFMWQPAGTTTLTAGITSAATTLQVSTTGLPLSMDAGSYPALIQVGTEIMSLASVPGGATSPQTFTGITRAMNGTTAVPHAAADPIALYPASRWQA